MPGEKNFYAAMMDARSHEPRTPAEKAEHDKLEMESTIRNLRSAITGLEESYAAFYRALHGYGMDIYPEGVGELTLAEKIGETFGTDKAKLRGMRRDYKNLQEALERAEIAMQELQQRIAAMRENNYRTMAMVGVEPSQGEHATPSPSRGKRLR